MKESKQLIVESCIGTSCHLFGAEDLLAVLKRLPQEIQDYIDIRAVTCLQQCGKGPNVRINGEVMTHMTPERLLQVIKDNYKNSESYPEEE